MSIFTAAGSAKSTETSPQASVYERRQRRAAGDQRREVVARTMTVARMQAAFLLREGFLFSTVTGSLEGISGA
ncbi:hypothetical protein AK51_21800 [Serratia nematodiphila DZ0503SBS1]|nr:hypothetical protein AK51_21800 [Serratia nematodiphila DZ0503SBS1]